LKGTANDQETHARARRQGPLQAQEMKPAYVVAAIVAAYVLCNYLANRVSNK
jgi:hypothetical protein